MPTGQRHLARIVALQTLFELEFAANSPDSVLERTLKTKALIGDSASFAGELVHGVLDNQDQLNDTIKRFATAFPVDQLAPMDRNILRIALYEILIDQKTPAKVAVNEAVELAKEFGADTSPKFVNGVLGAVIPKDKERKNQID
jgi:transcription antitermination protein NusB